MTHKDQSGELQAPVVSLSLDLTVELDGAVDRADAIERAVEYLKSALYKARRIDFETPEVVDVY